MVANGWTEKVEQLEKENAELKETIKVLRNEITLLNKIITSAKLIIIK